MKTRTFAGDYLTVREAIRAFGETVKIKAFACRLVGNRCVASVSYVEVA